VCCDRVLGWEISDRAVGNLSGVKPNEWLVKCSNVELGQV
jgi:hypothetical protein